MRRDCDFLVNRTTALGDRVLKYRKQGVSSARALRWDEVLTSSGRTLGVVMWRRSVQREIQGRWWLSAYGGMTYD